MIKTTTSLPKILFISDEIPQSIHAGSIQFYRIFKDYPTDKIMVIGRAPDAEAEKLNCNYYELEFRLLDKLRTSRLSSFLTDTMSLGFLLPSLPKKLEKIANDFKPDIVISLMQLLYYYYPAYSYAKKNDIPFYLFCHDDVEDFAQPHRLFKKKLLALNKKIYQYAQRKICISPEMAYAWEIKYEAKGEYFLPIASSDIQARPLSNCNQLIRKNQLTLAYAGSLAYGYREGLLEILPALEQNNTKLKVYRNNNEDYINSQFIEFVGYADTPEETWLRIINECDAVILPYTKQTNFKKLYSTHFPSKLGDYLKLQMPILIYGPDYATGVKFAKTNNKNFFVATTQDLLITQLNKLKSDEERLNIARNNLKLAKVFNRRISDLLF